MHYQRRNSNEMIELRRLMDNIYDIHLMETVANTSTELKLVRTNLNYRVLCTSTTAIFLSKKLSL